MTELYVLKSLYIRSSEMIRKLSRGTVSVNFAPLEGKFCERTLELLSVNWSNAGIVTIVGDIIYA